MSATEAEIRASKAARIIDDIGPYLASMEAEAFEMALATDRTTDAGRAQADDFLRLVKVIRGLSGKLEHTILEGKASAVRDTSRRMVA